MTLRELFEMFIDERSQEIAIYDLTQEKVVWTGQEDDIPEEYEWAEISSIDNLEKGTDILTVNIDISE